MLAFLIRRVLTMVLTALCLTFVVFYLTNLPPKLEILAMFAPTIPHRKTGRVNARLRRSGALLRHRQSRVRARGERQRVFCRSDAEKPG